MQFVELSRPMFMLLVFILLALGILVGALLILEFFPKPVRPAFVQAEMDRYEAEHAALKRSQSLRDRRAERVCDYPAPRRTPVPRG